MKYILAIIIYFLIAACAQAKPIDIHTARRKYQRKKQNKKL